MNGRHRRATRAPLCTRLGALLCSAALLVSGAAAPLMLGGCGASSAELEQAKQGDYHYQLAVSHFSEGQIPQAIRELTLALQQSPEHADALHLMGFTYMGRKQYPEAVRYFRAALEARPDYFICMNNLGVALLFMERWGEAAEIFEQLRAATLYTSPWLAYANLGWAYYKMGRVHEAIEETKMALFLNPEMCLAANNLGIMQAERLQIDEATASFESAIAQCPGYAEPHLHLGHMWVEAGNTSRAYSHFRKCMDLSPRSGLGERCRKNAQMIR